MSNTVLVTGGAGFIGSHLVDALLADGYAVRVVDDLSSGFLKNLEQHGSRVQPIIADISEMDVAREVCRDVEFVLHHAAVPSVPRSVSNPFATQRAGEIATLTLLEACAERKVRRVMLAASSSAYGGSDEFPARETHTPSPLSPYAASKLACEYYLRAYVHCRGLDGIAFRYFNIFGPRQDPSSPYSAVISVFLDRIRKGERPHIFGDGEQSRDFTYVANVVHANLLAIRAKTPLAGTVCNVGCGERVTLNALVTVLNAELGTAIEPTFGPPRPGDARQSQADISQANRVLGYVPQVMFGEGIHRLVGYDSAQQARN